ncbi:MAG: CsbD family protein [Betaproteobacteria bacterium]
MNKDQIKGAGKVAAGKIQEGVGKAIDSKTQQAKGLAKQATGQAQKSYGDAKEIVKDAAKDAE